MTQLQLSGFYIDITYKPIKHLYLRLYSNADNIKVSAPLRTPIDRIHAFIISKNTWIQKKRIQQTIVRTPTLQDGERHFFSGKAYPLTIHFTENRPYIKLTHSHIKLYTSPNASTQKKYDLLDHWYRTQLLKKIQCLIEQYSKIMHVEVNEYRIKRMKTKWGTCNTQAKRIWLNLVLIKHPPSHLEYVVVHELTHLLEPSHNKRFKTLMDDFLPNWKQYENSLNKLIL